MQYYRNDSNYIVQAEQFKIGNLDNFVNFLKDECVNITIHPHTCAVIETAGFGGDGILVVPEYYYLVMGSAIPNTFPKPQHEFSIVSPTQFRIRFNEFPFKKVEITLLDEEYGEDKE